MNASLENSAQSAGAEHALTSALSRIQNRAIVGEQRARELLRDLERCIGSTEERLRGALSHCEHAGHGNSQDGAAIAGYIRDLREDLLRVTQARQEELECQADRAGRFVVLLFGRTMAGKSTLMEILTNGSGETIGKGAQRTTRDIREYTWKGLTIVDTPGVCAFQGAEDERLAEEAATAADLVVFLMTNDGPQPGEAKWAARLMKRGKPLLGLLNVKEALSADSCIDTFEEDLTEAMDASTLDGVVEQFHAFMKGEGVPARCNFRRVHLRAHFLARDPNKLNEADRLRDLSRVDDFLHRLASEVVGRGAFLKYRALMDCVSAHALAQEERIVAYSELLDQAAQTLKTKRDDLKYWTNEFSMRSHSRTTALVREAFEPLRNAVPGFVEDHAENKNIQDEWKQLVEKHHERITRSLDHGFRELADECEQKLVETERRLKETNRLNIELQASEASIEHGTVTDFVRYAQRFSIGAGALQAVAAVVAVALGVKLAPVLAIGGAVVAAMPGVGASIGQQFEILKSAEKQREQIRSRHLHLLQEDVERMRQDVESRLHNQRHSLLIRNQLGQAESELDRRIGVQIGLANAMSELAFALREIHIKATRHSLRELYENLEYTDVWGLLLREPVARLPGRVTIVPDAFLNTLTPQQQTSLQDLWGDEALLTWSSIRMASVQAVQELGDGTCTALRGLIRGAAQLDHLDPQSVLLARSLARQYFTAGTRSNSPGPQS